MAVSSLLDKLASSLIDDVLMKLEAVVGVLTGLLGMKYGKLVGVEAFPSRKWASDELPLLLLPSSNFISLKDNGMGGLGFDARLLLLPLQLIRSPPALPPSDFPEEGKIIDFRSTFPLSPSPLIAIPLGFRLAGFLEQVALPFPTSLILSRTELSLSFPGFPTNVSLDAKSHGRKIFPSKVILISKVHKSQQGHKTTPLNPIFNNETNKTREHKQIKNTTKVLL